MPKPLTQADVVNATIGYWNAQEQAMDPYFYQGKLTPTYTANKTVSLYFGETDTPGRLDRKADDTEVNIIKTSGFATDEYKLLDFGKGKTVTEQIRDDIRTLLASPNTDDATRQVLGAKLYTDMSVLFSWDLFTKENMFWEAILTGKLNIGGDGLRPAHYVFHRPDEHEVKTKVAWGNSDSTPLDDLKNAVRKMSLDNNTVIAEAVMNPNTFGKLAESGQVRSTLYPNASSKNLAVNYDAAKSAALIYSGLNTLTVYDKADSDGYFIPNDTVLFVPAGPLGKLAYSDTNSSKDLVGDPTASFAVAQNGATLYTYTQHNPNIMTGVIESRFLPVIDKIQNVMTMHTGDDTSSKRDGTSYSFDTYTPSNADNPNSGSANNNGGSKSSGANK